MFNSIFIGMLFILFSFNALATDLTGKNLRYSYDNGDVYEVSFLSPSKLFWKALEGSEPGTSSTETYVYKMIDTSIYQVGWVEASGFTVSQVINLKSMKISSHLIFVESSGQNPTLLPVTGTIKEL